MVFALRLYLIVTLEKIEQGRRGGILALLHRRPHANHIPPPRGSM